MSSVSHWSTTDVAKRESFAYWRDAVCQAILQVDVEVEERQGFDASISSSSAGCARLAGFGSNPHKIVRNSQHIARANEGGYLVSWQQAGQSRIYQSDAPLVIEAGEIGIIDAERAFHITFPTSVKRTLALVPRQMLEERAPWLRRSGPIKIGRQSEYTRLACDHVALLADGSGRGASQSDLLVSNLCNLLAIATYTETTPEGAVELPTETMLNFCRKHLFAATLSPNMVARSLRVSLRTVHSRFQKLGTTFGAWVLNERLEECRRALENTMYDRRSISEIAFDCGFKEMSHFSKSFKQKFGASPREYRGTLALPH